MDVSSVTRSPSVVPTRRTEQVEQAEPREQPPEDKKEVARAAERQNEAKRPPVVNTQGQTTGRLVNTTA